MMPIPDLPDIWDTHVHLLDPERFPYSDNRTYTPRPAKITDLLHASPGHNFLIVQASVEDGSTGLLTRLNELHQSHPDRTFRGAVMVDGSNTESCLWSDQDLKQMQSAGVRCLRLRMSGSWDAHQAAAAVKATLEGQVGDIVRAYGWVVSMQLPLQTWAILADYLRSRMANTGVIAEHCAGLHIPLSFQDKTAFETLLGMVRDKLVVVKLGGLHRRLRAGAKLDELQDPIQALARSGPEQLIWGSDWPHVNSSGSKTIQSEHLSVDARFELERLCAWLPPDTVRLMLSSNPSRLFAA